MKQDITEKTGRTVDLTSMNSAEKVDAFREIQADGLVQIRQPKTWGSVYGNCIYRFGYWINDDVSDNDRNRILNSVNEDVISRPLEEFMDLHEWRRPDCVVFPSGEKNDLVQLMLSVVDEKIPGNLKKAAFDRVDELSGLICKTILVIDDGNAPVDASDVDVIVDKLAAQNHNCHIYIYKLFDTKDVSEHFAEDMEEFLKEFLEDCWDEYDDLDNNTAEKFAEDIMEILYELIDEGNDSGKYSDMIVRYRFKDVSQYKEYAKLISSKADTTSCSILSIRDYPKVIGYLRALFEDNETIQFCNTCELYNKKERINLTLHAYSDKVPRNYIRKAVDVCVRAADAKVADAKDNVVSLYAIDAAYLEKRFEDVIHKYCG